MGASNNNKGKQVATGKGKRPADNDKTHGGGRNKRNRGVVQFFDDVARDVDDDDDDDDDVSDISDFGDDWDFEDNFEAQPSNVNNEAGKSHNVPVFPKEEELSDGELEKMVAERYRSGASYVSYAEDRPNNGRNVDGNEGLPSYKEPTIWKVKCMIGREKQSVFCLMQKYVELNSLGSKLHVISAISVEHIKGFIYIEAERQSDINEACKGVSTIYSSRLAPVPKSEVSTSLSVRSKSKEVSIGSWARVKNGKYRGDLAQVIAVNDSRKKATVKLIPRIDLQVLAEKYGGGVASKKKKAVPAPRLVSSTELEEFRPLIQYRRDRESGLAFDVLDGMMLKDGYLYKKVLMDSLNLYGVIPTEEELLKFETSKNEAPDCQEWLTELYGEKKKQPRVAKSDKGGAGKGEGGKGEGSSSSNMEASFEVNDLVLFNKKEFGVIVGLEKEEYYRVLKEGSEGPVVLTVDMRQLKKASFENRFTALDKHKKMISINDNVRVLEGPLEGRQGNVKHIYRGIIFLHDEIEQENNGYFCCKSQICEKVKFSIDASRGKDGESSFPAFDDPPSSPKSPLAPEKPWETRGRNSSFNREGEEGSFTVGQSLRIRVGPLKGYLCRVLAVRRTGVTVKLDSQHKILTVKSEHLAEVRGRSSAIPMSDDKDAKPFDLLGNPDGSTDWMAGAGTSADGERSSWPAFPSSGTSAQPESNSAMETDEKEEGGGGWGSKVTPKPSSAWGSTATDVKPVVESEQAGGWGNKPKTSTEDQSGSSQGAGGWGSGGGNWGNKSKTSTEEQIGSSQAAGTDWGSKPITVPSNDATSTWGKKDKADQGGCSEDAGGNWGSKPNTAPSNDATSTWGTKDNTSNMGPPNSWGKENNAASGGSNWGKSVDPVDKVSGESVGGWGNDVVKPTTQTAAWGKPPSSDGDQAEKWGKSEKKKDDSSPGWGKPPNVGDGQGGSWGKMKTQDDGRAPAWGKTVESSDGGQGGSWGKTEKKDDGGAPAWGKSVESSDQGGSWGKSNSKRDETEPAWGKKVESSDGDGVQGGSWGKSNTKKVDDTPAWGKAVESSDGGQGGSWGKSNTKKDDDAPAWGKSNTKKDEDAPAWGKAVESSDGGQGGSWGKSNTKKVDDAPAWGQAVDSSNGGQGGSWGKKAETSDGGQGGSWGKSSSKKDDGAPAWGKTVESSDGNSGKGSGNDSWGKPPPPKPWAKKDDSSETKAAWNSSASAQGGGWGSGGGSSWGKQNDGTNEGGGGGGGDFGGRRGRGGWRGGGRDDQGGERGGRGGGGRWSDQGGGERGGRSGFRGRGRSDYGSGGFGGRGRGRRDENNNSSDWGNNQNGGNGGQSWGSTGGNSGGGGWSKGGNQSSGWGTPKESNEGQPSILGKPNIGGDGAQSSGWGASKGSDGGGGSSGQWGKPPGGSSSWGKSDSDGGSKGGW